MKKDLNDISLTNKIVFFIYFIILGFISLITFDTIFSDVNSKEYKFIHIAMDVIGMIVITVLL